MLESEVGDDRGRKVLGGGLYRGGVVPGGMILFGIVFVDAA